MIRTLPLAVKKLEPLLERPSRQPKGSAGLASSHYKQELFNPWSKQLSISGSVAKAYLDVNWAVQCRRFSNERSGHAALVRWLKTSQTPVQLICEASGGYEQPLLESLAEEHVAITFCFTRCRNPSNESQ